jgi:hypothetical protein
LEAPVKELSEKLIVPASRLVGSVSKSKELIVPASRLVGSGSKSKETSVKIGEAPEGLRGKDSIPLKN